MALRQRISASPETVSDLAWAAEERFRESAILFEEQHYHGCIYLSGLASEMWLKFACFRSLGASVATAVDSQLGPAKDWMRKNAPVIRHESFHSLYFWAEYLIRRRAQLGRPLSKIVIGDLRHHVVHRLYQDWKIELRYSSTAVTQAEALRVLRDSSWLRGMRDNLWRR